MNFDKLIKKKKKGYYFRIDVGKGRNGKRKQASFGPFKTKADAKEELLKVKSQVVSGDYLQESTMEFPIFIKEWFETTYKRNVEITTAKSREYLINNHLINPFSNKRINEIKTIDIDYFYLDKIDEGYSPAYIRHMHNLLRQAFGQAVKWELIKSNPAINAKPPKIRKTDKNIWNVNEVKNFLNLTKGHSNSMAYLLAIFTGMRRGEILALSWSDIDFRNNKIHIKRSLAYVPRIGIIIKNTKTSASKRQISISEFVINELKKLQEKQVFQKEKMGHKYEDNHLVITTEHGKPINPRNLLRQFYGLIEEAEIPKISFHDLRHTHATIMMEQGENPKVVSERLGHSRVSVTLDLYSHVSDDLQKEAADKFEQTIFESE